MWSPALLLSAGLLVVVANPYGNGGKQTYDGPPVYPQNYHPSQQQKYNNYPQGSGRPQYQQQSGYGQQQSGSNYGQQQSGSNYGKSNYEQQQYNQPSQQDQYDSEYNYAQQPLYPENPTYYTQYQPPSPTPYKTTQYETTPDPETTKTDPKSTKTGTTSTTKSGTGTTSGKTTSTGGTKTTPESTKSSKTDGTKTTPESTKSSKTGGTKTTVATTEIPSSSTKESGGPTQSTKASGGPTQSTKASGGPTQSTKASGGPTQSTKKSSGRTGGVSPQADVTADPSEKSGGVGCKDIPSDEQVCARNPNSVSLAVDCSVVTAGKIGTNLIKATGVCPSSCSNGNDKIVEYTYNAVQNHPDSLSAISNGDVSLIVTCPDPAKFCTCSAMTCCQIEGGVKSVVYIPHCTTKNCHNVLFIEGEGSLKCKSRDGTQEKVFSTKEQSKNQTLDSDFLIRSMTSVSCNGCAALNKGNSCVKL